MHAEGNFPLSDWHYTVARIAHSHSPLEKRIRSDRSGKKKIQKKEKDSQWVADFNCHLLCLHYFLGTLLHFSTFWSRSCQRLWEGKWVWLKEVWGDIQGTWKKCDRSEQRCGASATLDYIFITLSCLWDLMMLISSVHLEWQECLCTKLE